MKYGCSLLLTILFYFPLTAQIEFAPVGAVYYYLFETQSGPDHQNSEFQILEIAVTGDTLIQGETCSILEGGGVTVNWIVNCGATSQNRAFVYEENGLVFYYHVGEENFQLLYDFNATAGESWEIATNCEELQYCLDTTTVMTVDSVRTEIMNGQEIDVQYVLGRKIYRGIGLNGPLFFFTSWYCTTIHFYLRGLRCYSDPVLGDFHFYNDLGDCTEYVTSTQEPLEAETLRVFPNPSPNQIRLTAETAFTWQLFTVTGQLISTQQQATRSTSFSVQEQPSGVYFVKITFTNGESVLRKVVRD